MPPHLVHDGHDLLFQLVAQSPVDRARTFLRRRNQHENKNNNKDIFINIEYVTETKMIHQYDKKPNTTVNQKEERRGPLLSAAAG